MLNSTFHTILLHTRPVCMEMLLHTETISVCRWGVCSGHKHVFMYVCKYMIIFKWSTRHLMMMEISKVPYVCQLSTLCHCTLGTNIVMLKVSSLCLPIFLAWTSTCWLCFTNTQQLYMLTMLHKYLTAVNADYASQILISCTCWLCFPNSWEFSRCSGGCPYFEAGLLPQILA